MPDTCVHTRGPEMWIPNNIRIAKCDGQFGGLYTALSAIEDAQLRKLIFLHERNDSITSTDTDGLIFPM